MSLPDVSVRPALPDDADLIWSIQRRALLEDVASALGGQVPAPARAEIEAQDGAEAWRQSIGAVPQKAAVLVALRGDRVVGYGTLVPLAEPVDTPDGHSVIDAEISALDVRPADQRSGHGSRVLAALMDYADTFGFRAVATWGIAGEESRTRFLTSAGFAPLGLKRELDVMGQPVTQVGWYAVPPERSA